jgi:hypothetical protein
MLERIVLMHHRLMFQSSKQSDNLQLHLPLLLGFLHRRRLQLLQNM